MIYEWKGNPNEIVKRIHVKRIHESSQLYY